MIGGSRLTAAVVEKVVADLDVAGPDVVLFRLDKEDGFPVLQTCTVGAVAVLAWLGVVMWKIGLSHGPASMSRWIFMTSQEGKHLPTETD